MHTLKTNISRDKKFCLPLKSLYIERKHRASDTSNVRVKETLCAIDGTFTCFFFSIFIYRRQRIQPRGLVARCEMKARHQFKKSTPSVAGKNAAPLGGWVFLPAAASSPKRPRRSAPSLSLSADKYYN